MAVVQMYFLGVKRLHIPDEVVDKIEAAGDQEGALREWVDEQDLDSLPWHQEAVVDEAYLGELDLSVKY